MFSVKKLAVVAIALFAVFFVVKRTDFLSSSQSSVQVAITQIAPHPSLDQIRQGILDVLAEDKRKSVTVVYQNAQGSLSTAAQISQHFLSLNPSVVVPITTPSAQSISKTFSGKETPIVFAGVTDPVSAKLTADLSKPSLTITGIYDLPPFEGQALQIKQVLLANNKDLSVAILYNVGEANSVVISEKMTQVLTSLGISVTALSVSSTTQVSGAAQLAASKASAIYIPNDNTVVSALEAVLKVTNSLKIPVFASDPESVGRGCLLAYAPNQYEMGRQAGRMILRILQGEKNLLIEKAHVHDLSINTAAERHLGITIPPHIRQQATNVISS